MPLYLVPLAPLMDFCVALAIAFAASSYFEHREYRAIRVRKEDRR